MSSPLNLLLRRERMRCSSVKWSTPHSLSYVDGRSNSWMVDWLLAAQHRTHAIFQLKGLPPHRLLCYAELMLNKNLNNNNIFSHLKCNIVMNTYYLQKHNNSKVRHLAKIVSLESEFIVHPPSRSKTNITCILEPHCCPLGGRDVICIEIN